MANKVAALHKKQKDVFYTVHIQQGFDGHFSVKVDDVADDERSRIAVAEALIKAAEIIKGSL